MPAQATAVAQSSTPPKSWFWAWCKWRLGLEVTLALYRLTLSETHSLAVSNSKFCQLKIQPHRRRLTKKTWFPSY
jgi:hypothetical protein